VGGDKAKLTIYPGVGHNSWSATYANQEVYDWLLSHRREK
jgi:predicted peptidase